MITPRVTRTLGCLALFLCCSPVRAEMILTKAAIDRGFSLTTFATGFSNWNSVGPLGIEFPVSGGVLVTDVFGNVRRFPTNADGQSALTVPPTVLYGFRNAADLVRHGDVLYMTQANKGYVVQINDDGTLNRVVATGLGDALGIVVNPNNGNLFVALGGPRQIVEVNPVIGASQVFRTGLGIPDGLSISLDGKSLFVAELESNRVRGFDTISGAQVFDSGFVQGGPDGTALGTGILTGNLYANFNNGTLVEFNLQTGAQTLLATGGSRGDFAAVDPYNNTLLVTQTDRVVRLIAPSGGGFGDGPMTVVPEPSGVILLALGAFSLAGYRWHRRKQIPKGGEGWDALDASEPEKVYGI